MKEFFTIPDPDITSESSVDPMGIQVIWTHYGQEIFNEKLTTIANDLRVFTFNLFHNHLINSLYKNYPEQIQEAKNRYKAWATDADVKTGLLMFLEDVVTWTFYLHSEAAEQKVDAIGILGLTKARVKHNSYPEDQIFLEAYKRAGLLKNQINLGMTGRYKGPMINMEFIDRSFCYYPKTWENVERFMTKWSQAMGLELKLSELIIDKLLKSNYKDYPRFTLTEVKRSKLYKEVCTGYLSCFGSSKVPKAVREYWRDKLGLLSGAPKALYDQIALVNNGEYIDHSKIFSGARANLKNEPAELEKVETIINIEPFLSHAEYLLRYLGQQSVKNLPDIQNDLMILRKEITAAAMFIVHKPVTRLSELAKVMRSEGTLTEWLIRVLEYHKKIMDDRGGNKWVELDSLNNFKHYFGVPLPKEINTIPKYLDSKGWLHTYYLGTVRNIYEGLN